jgi:hypothetical protein
VRAVGLPPPAGVLLREKQIGGSGGSLEPPVPLLEPPGTLLTRLQTVYIAYFECLPTRLSPLAERTCFPLVLLHGPPGTGKTLLAKVVATASGWGSLAFGLGSDAPGWL